MMLHKHTRATLTAHVSASGNIKKKKKKKLLFGLLYMQSGQQHQGNWGDAVEGI